MATFIPYRKDRDTVQKRNRLSIILVHKQLSHLELAPSFKKILQIGL
jgi:hypothetical protein